MSLEWWHWVSGGIVLCVLELVVPSFTILWFGLGAVIVGLLLALLPGMPLSLQLGVWLATSVLFVALWFRYLRPMVDRTKAGLSSEAVIGQVGLVSRPTRDPFEKGKVRFQTPVCGDEEWTAISDAPMREGDRVRVVGVEGQILKVTKEG